METPRPGPEKLGAVRTDPDLIGLLFTLIYRATSHRQERAQTPGCLGATTAGKGLIYIGLLALHETQGRNTPVVSSPPCQINAKQKTREAYGCSGRGGG